VVSPPVASSPVTDPALVAILTSLVNRVDQMTIDQNKMAQANNVLLQQLTQQQAAASVPQRSASVPHQLGSTQPTPNVQIPVPENVGVPSETSNRNKRFYAVARGRRTGVFTKWKDAEKSVKGYSGAIHKRFRSEEAALSWLRSKRSDWNDDASEISGDFT
jgi:hypothetical protein